MRNKRLFSSGILIHCYQNTRNGFLLFHSVSDYLTLFTRICIAAKTHGVVVVALCFMPDHLHLAVIAPDSESLSAFVRDYTASFSIDYGRTWEHKGPLFNAPFGSALKKGAKAARTNIIYIGNNPVERQLSKTAGEYRWNFLAYRNNPCPYSEPYVVRRACGAMRNAVKEVKALHSCGKPVNYGFLKRICKELNNTEKQQLADIIIRTYSVIDYDYAARFFDSWDDMLSAMRYNTGSEYDLNEVFIGKSDAVYRKLTSLIIHSGRFEDIHDIFALTDAEKIALANRLYAQTRVNPTQIAKFLHLKLLPHD